MTMQIRIDQQFAALGLEIHQPQTQLKTKAPVTETKNCKNDAKIKYDFGSFKIDATKSREALDLYTPKVLGKRTARQAVQASNQLIQKKASEGDQMARIENRVSIAHLAKESIKVGSLDVKQKPGPDVKYQKGKGLQINWNLKPAKINTTLGDVQINAQWGRVDQFIRQQNYIDITYTGSLIDFIK